MSNSSSAALIWLFTATVLGTTIEALPSTQADGPAQTGSRIATALRFIQAIYPDQEVASGRMQIVGELLRGMDTRQLSVQLSAGELLTVRNDADMKRSHCYGTFTFSDFGLVKFFGDGVCARAADNAAFISSVAAHPLWSDKQIAAELLRLGARYGPDSKERLIERISAAAIGEAVAEPLDLREVTFVMPERVSGRIELHGDALVWMSTFTIVNRQNATIVALIEPFDGRLKSLFRIPPE